MSCKVCPPPRPEDRKGLRGFCPLCGWNLTGFSVNHELRGHCSNKLCPNYQDNNPGGIRFNPLEFVNPRD